MPDQPEKDAREEGLEELREQMAVAFGAADLDPQGEEAQKSMAQVQMGYHTGWDKGAAYARAHTPAAPGSGLAVGETQAWGAPAAPAAVRSRKVSDLQPGDSAWVQPYALIEHRPSGAIYLDPLFDCRPQAEPGYNIRVSVDKEGKVVARGPHNEHRQTDDRPGKAGMRLVRRFEGV